MTHDELVNKLAELFEAKTEAKFSKGLPFYEEKAKWQKFKQIEKELQSYVNIYRSTGCKPY